MADYFQDHGVERPQQNSRISNPNVEDFMSPPVARAYHVFEGILNGNNRQHQQMPILDSILQQLLTDDQQQSNKNPPAAKNFISNLPDLKQVMDKSCNICLDSLDKKESTVLPCNSNHYFHRECLVPWLEIHNTCPCCRHEFITDDVEYERRKRELRDQQIREQDSEEEWDPFYS